MSVNEAEEPLPEEGEQDINPSTEGAGTVGRLKRLGRRLMSKEDLADDTREILGAMLETSDKAKTEVVKLVAREVRTYLEELKVMDDLKDLMTSHSLELKVSMNLKPLAEKLDKTEPNEPPADEEEAPSEPEEDTE